ncbi:MAG: 4-hydroxy-3-methylbut-2-enyl diphosphate reductase [Candidatus Eisenbacteria bacterium]|nr:4-hydroxy-3-methylbut-2-enyl diphosphate reductase [Candidatus Eisenbacteria bacterium]
MKDIDVILAKNAGPCFGVKRAIAIARSALEKQNGPIYSLGPIIHNRQVVDKLAGKGLRVVDDVRSIEAGTVIVRCHGVGPEPIREAKARGLEVIDATCPFVERCHEYARQLSREGYFTVVVGDTNHPEVVATVANAGGRACVVNSPEGASACEDCEKLGIIAQTTQSRERFYSIVSVLVEKARNARVHNTICNITSLKQAATRELASSVDVMVIVGGRESANTRRLFDMSKEKNQRTYQVEGPSELEKRWFDGISAAGVMGGASTPDWILEDVVKWVRERGGE